MNEYKPQQVYEDRDGDQWRVNDEGLLCIWVGDRWYEGPDGAPPEVIERDLGPLKLINDPVNRPSHYTQFKGFEVIDITSQLDFVTGNCVKYLLRAPHKGKELEDLKKARWYLDYRINQLERSLEADSGN